jgi:DNA-directed RNA polymerase specialized sigma24 family protein
MRTGTKRSNEELIFLYRENENDSYLQELMEQNKGLFHILINGYVSSIPNAEYEDLLAESYIAMIKAIKEFDFSKGIKFSSLLKVYVRQHLNRIYNEATRQKRYTGSTPVSYEGLVEINKEGGDITESSFSVECEDIASFEFRELLNSLNLNDKEQVAVNVLMAGGSKGEVAQALKCTPATANYYFKSIRKKFVFAGICL